MNYLIFARWFGLVSVILSLGILFNLEDAREMARNMVKSESGYIMGGCFASDIWQFVSYVRQQP